MMSFVCLSTSGLGIFGASPLLGEWNICVPRADRLKESVSALLPSDLHLVRNSVCTGIVPLDVPMFELSLCMNTVKL